MVNSSSWFWINWWVNGLKTRIKIEEVRCNKIKSCQFSFFFNDIIFKTISRNFHRRSELSCIILCSQQATIFLLRKRAFKWREFQRKRHGYCSLSPIKVCHSLAFSFLHSFLLPLLSSLMGFVHFMVVDVVLGKFVKERRLLGMLMEKLLSEMNTIRPSHMHMVNLIY